LRRRVRRAALARAVGCGGRALWSAAAGGQAPPPPRAPEPGAAALAQRGRALYAEGCATCHGQDLRGVRGMGPSLLGAGAAAADFALSTGRMPLADPTDQPQRTEPLYSRAQIEALVAYVGSFGGPAIPTVDPSRGDVARGKALFTESCAGCHQVVARGGIVTGAFVPALSDVPPRQLGEAVRTGPYLMPPFDERRLAPAELDDIAAYLRLTRQPDDRGGWGIGHLGPVPEGLITWVLAVAALLGVARLLGERAP
jgi:ubiquinol-cytochrome c reductase cytochrome c subunit